MSKTFPIMLACLGLALPAAAQESAGPAGPNGLAKAEGTAVASGISPRPTNDPGNWVRSEDYPAWAVRNELEGRVSFKLGIDAEGHVTGCEITASSGTTELDTLACAKVTERARFDPARDADGNAVPGTWASTVVWNLTTGGLPRVPQPAALSVTMIVERDGTVSECHVEQAEGSMAGAGMEACERMPIFAPVLDAEGNPQRTRIRMTTSFVHEPLPD